jgi:hypothetical protein
LDFFVGPALNHTSLSAFGALVTVVIAPDHFLLAVNAITPTTHSVPVLNKGVILDSVFACVEFFAAPVYMHLSPAQSNFYSLNINTQPLNFSS